MMPTPKAMNQTRTSNARFSSRFLGGVTMRSRQMLGWIVGLSLLCALPVRGQETKPISERPGSSAWGLAAESDLSNETSVHANINQVTTSCHMKYGGLLTDLADYHI